MRRKEQMRWLSDDLLNIEMAIRDLHSFLTTVWTHLSELMEDKKSEE